MAATRFQSPAAAGYPAVHQRDHDPVDPLSSEPLSGLHELLHPPCPAVSAARVSRSARFVALMPRVLMPLYVYLLDPLLWPQHRPPLHRLDALGGLSQPAHLRSSSFCRPRAAGQACHGLVLWLQTPSGPQRAGCAAGFRPHARQRGRPQAGIPHDPSTVGQTGGRQRLYLPGAGGGAVCSGAFRLLTRLRAYRKPKLVTLADHWLLRPRVLVESVHDQLKHIAQVEHTRHRSPANFLVNLLSGLIAYCHQPRKPSLARGRSLREPASYP